MSLTSPISANSGLTTFFQNIKSATASDSTGQTQAPKHVHKAGGDADRESRFTQALQDQGISGDKLSDLRDKIHTAVQQAKSTSDDPQAVREAVNGVLKDAGVDLDKLHAELAAAKNAANTPSAPASDGANPTAADSTATSASGIDSLLSQSGIDPDQFKSKLASMLQNGEVDTSSLFADAAPGADVDVFA